MSVRSVHASFQAAYAQVQAVAADPLDLPASAFADDAAAFNAAITDLERRLASVLCQARASAPHAAAVLGQLCRSQPRLTAR